MPSLHAQPYDTSASGFYFDSAEEFAAKYDARLPVEEYELQFIDGTDLDCGLAVALGLTQANVEAYFTACEDWTDEQKVNVILYHRDQGVTVDADEDPGDIDGSVYQFDGHADWSDLASRFCDEGLFGDIPKHLENYIDHEAMGRDLSHDYGQAFLNGDTYFYSFN
jgi:hypothetical protein